ncbi:hypothetical protein A9K55_003377 [Cordyceps militaris]|uniref:Uncharacterized protein n=1 Tax=Cordyceps militaris TaxID=73501 RepID=A0A2H4S7Y4_CORMI|nr:hypothetical protein A9K55_003377 [Cordyceps militaris]
MSDTPLTDRYFGTTPPAISKALCKKAWEHNEDLTRAERWLFLCQGTEDGQFLADAARSDEQINYALGRPPPFVLLENIQMTVGDKYTSVADVVRDFWNPDRTADLNFYAHECVWLVWWTLHTAAIYSRDTPKDVSPGLVDAAGRLARKLRPEEWAMEEAMRDRWMKNEVERPSLTREDDVFTRQETSKNHEGWWVAGDEWHKECDAREEALRKSLWARVNEELRNADEMDLAAVRVLQARMAAEIAQETAQEEADKAREEKKEREEKARKRLDREAARGERRAKKNRGAAVGELDSDVDDDDDGGSDVGFPIKWSFGPTTRPWTREDAARQDRREMEEKIAQERDLEDERRREEEAEAKEKERLKEEVHTSPPPRRCVTMASASSPAATAYTRVGVPDGGGPGSTRLYALLSSFVRDASLAPRVTELVIDLGGKGTPYGHRPEESPDLSHVVLPDVPADDEVYAALRRRILDLGMDEARTERMARALRWRATAAPDAGRRTRRPGSLAMRADDDSHFAAQWQLTAGVLLLSFCENVDTLYLGPLEHGHLLLREYMLRANYGLLPQPRPLQKLRRVEVLTHDPNGWTPTVELGAHLQLVHRLPSLARLAVDNAQVYQPSWNLAAARASSMTELSITHFDIDHDWVARVLRVPRALRKFTLSVGGVANTDGGMPMMSKAVVGRSLWKHRKTLTHVDVDLSIFTHDSDRVEEEEDLDRAPSDWELRLYGADYLGMDRDLAAAASFPSNDDAPPPHSAYGHTIGSFREFPVLANLAISIRTLLGNKRIPLASDDDASDAPASPEPANASSALAAMLPASLESLTLYGYVRGDDASLDAQVDDLMRRKGGAALPKLRDVRGVEETVEDIQMIFGDEPEEEEDLWQGLKRDLSWKKVSEEDKKVQEDEEDEEDDEN